MIIKLTTYPNKTAANKAFAERCTKIWKTEFKIKINRKATVFDRVYNFFFIWMFVEIFLCWIANGRFFKRLLLWTVWTYVNCTKKVSMYNSYYWTYTTYIRWNTNIHYIQYPSSPFYRVQWTNCTVHRCNSCAWSMNMCIKVWKHEPWGQPI